ncbi:LamG-like jellyroll fold domain-containing protein [uncultured Draconibacterium sp.]|uniref:LamG-like jellyroll fold domain-containing protein n=1 Tax=uncultured Draconibacterium sp. TaxID=1573823 RepID=UPI0029C8143F|nr:LamG-like jellyroll fold domain-containing protein [uncultured Draconibacterium sp.]
MWDFNKSVKRFVERKLNVKRDTRYLFLLFFVLLVNISNATVYYVSASGNDANTGTSESQPWKTLSKVSSTSFSPGDQILFKRGEEWSGTITVTSSGSAGSPIIYGAYGAGEKPRIYGSEEITGWTQHSGNIYKATFNKVVNQVFIGEERMQLARYPNSGYFTVDAVSSNTSFVSNDIDNSIDCTDAKCMIRTDAWALETRTVKSHNSNTININSSPHYSISVNEGFFLCNKLEFLDKAGQWYYDSNQKVVYLWTLNGDSPENYVIRGSVFNTIIDIEGKDYVTIQNIELRGAQESGISSNNASNITLENNSIFDVDYAAINIEGKNATGNKISRNTISGSNCYGIYNRTLNVTIDNNVISNIALHDQIGKAGISVQNTGNGIESRADNALIQYNRLINIGYHGIRFYGIDNVIEYNFVDGACVTLDDGGGIYAWSSDSSLPGVAGSVIRNNIVLNVIGNLEGRLLLDRMKGNGIYMDDNVRGVTIENNTVAHSGGNGIFIKNGNIEVLNNTVMDAAASIYITRGYSGPRVVKGNIVYAFDKTYLNNKVAFVVGWRISGSGTFDNNTYINHYNSEGIFRNQEDKINFEEWKKATGQDANSTLDKSPLGPGETEVLMYNDKKESKTISLGNTIYRDIEGNNVSGDLVLEPFKSKILIKTSSSGSNNQKPEIDDQTFGILGDKQVDDYIGQVVASDPDEGQTLKYDIVGGNEERLFYVDETSGVIYAATTLYETSDKKVQLVVSISDNSTEPLSASATITINITAVDDTDPPGGDTPPSINSFTIPSTSSSLTVPITSFSVDGNAAGYLITTSTEEPINDDSNWTTSVPLSYAFSESGTYTLYAWVKDANGNISTSSSATTTISLDVSSTYSEYKFEDGPGPNVIDSEGSNDGTIINEELRVDGVKGNGLQFTGAGYINLGQCFGENVTDGVTMSAWIKPTSTTGDYQGIIMHGGPDYDSFALYIHPDNQRLYFKTSGTSTERAVIDNVSKLWDGDWHHVAATYNGSEKVIYLDGQEIYSVLENGTIVSGVGYNLLIGAGRDYTSPTLKYTGYIDEVRVYNYGLTSSEVDDLYNSVVGSQDSVYTTEEISVCEGESYNDWTSAGEYQRELQSITGGDSIVTTYLTVNPVYDIIENIVIHAGENYNGWTASGEYVRNLTTVLGCDSTITTVLSVEEKSAHETVYTTEEISICEGESYNDWTSAGEYQRVLHSITGGDSIVTTYLAVNPVYDIVEDIVIQTGEDYNGWTTSGEYVRNLTTVLGCDSTITTILIVDEDSRHFVPVWDGENGQNHMTFVVTEALVDNAKLGIGDEIAVFDNDICVGSAVLTSSIDINDENSYIFISASQETGDLNGFTDGNKVIFKIWDSKEQVEKVANNVIYHDDLPEWIISGKFEPRGTSVVEIGYIYEEPVVTQTIQLEQGWNIFSAAVVPDEPNMEVIQNDLVVDKNLFKVQNEEGKTYEKIRSTWINNIGDLKQTEGYRIRVKSACNIEITGTQASLPMNIKLKAGSNLISFPYNGSVDAMQVIQPLIATGVLEKVQDQKGNSIEYWGAEIGWLNGIGNFIVGQGYQVQVNSDVVLTIGDMYEKSVLINEYPETVYFQPEFQGNGSNHMNINLFGFDESHLTIGDEIAAYDGEICVGAIAITATNLGDKAVSINASATDQGESNGFIEDNNIELKFWDSESNEVTDFNLSVVNGELTYNMHSSVFIKFEEQLLGDENETFSIDMYPNPATNNVNVRFSQIPESGAQLLFLDINGKQLQNRQVQSTLETIDISSYPAGLYFIKTIVGDFIKTNKLIKN